MSKLWPNRHLGAPRPPPILRLWLVLCDEAAEAVARGDKAALARAIAALRGEDR